MALPKLFIATCLLFILPIIFTSGCASIVTGQNQPLSIETRAKDGKQVVGAACQCVSDKGTYFVTTPGTIVVRRSYGDLLISCTKDQIEPGSAAVQSSTKVMTAGNCIFGGLVGIAIDAGTGAAYDYPSLITVIMGQAITIGPPPPAPSPQEQGTPVK